MMAAQRTVMLAITKAIREQRPEAPPAPPDTRKEQQANATRSRQAGDEQRRRATAGYGRSDTLLTGAGGLANDPTLVQRKTLLGM
jgi:hypothetical protein